MVSGRAGTQVCLIPKSELPTTYPHSATSPSGPSPSSAGLRHIQEACLRMGLHLLQEGPQNRRGSDACRYGTAHLPITLAGDSPSSQLEKLRPRLQATGKLPDGQSGWARPWLYQQPGPAGSHTQLHLHTFGQAAHHLKCPPDSGICPSTWRPARWKEQSPSESSWWGGGAGPRKPPHAGGGGHFRLTVPPHNPYSKRVP